MDQKEFVISGFNKTLSNILDIRPVVGGTEGGDPYKIFWNIFRQKYYCHNTCSHISPPDKFLPHSASCLALYFSPPAGLKAWLKVAIDSSVETERAIVTMALNKWDTSDWSVTSVNQWDVLYILQKDGFIERPYKVLNYNNVWRNVSTS